MRWRNAPRKGDRNLKAHLIKELRQKKGLSQKEFAAQINLDPSNLCKIEKGNHVPTLPVLERIANGLNVPVKKFF